MQPHRRRLPLYALVALLIWSLLPSGLALAASSSVEVVLSTTTPVVDSGDWAIVKVSYNCSAIISVPCENVVISSVIPPELARGISDVQVLDPSGDTTVSYDPASYTATWAFKKDLTAGSAGSFTLMVRFPKGSTADGTVATLRAEISSSNTPPMISKPLALTATAQPDARARKRFISGGVLDIPTVYQVEVYVPSSSGALDLTNVVMTDTLPLGAELVDADGGSYDAGTHTITWAGGSIMLSAGETALRHNVTVRFPSGTFHIGDEIRNNLTADVTAANGATMQLSGADVRLIQPPTPGPGFSKSGPSSAEVGDTLTYSFSSTNSGTAPLDAGHTFTDTLPLELDVSKIIAASHNQTTTIRLQIAYQTNKNASWQALPGAPFTTATCVGVNTANGCASSISLSAGERISALRYTYLDPLPYGFAVSGNGFAATVTSAPVNQIIVNSADATFSYNGHTIIQQDSVPTRVIEYTPGARPSLSKAVDPSIVHAGDTVTYTLTLTNNSFRTLSRPLLSPQIADLLVGDLVYTAGSQQVTAKPTGAPDPIFDIVPDYRASGRALLRWRWPGYSLAVGETITIQFQASIAPYTPTGALSNTGYLAGWDNQPDDIVLDSCSSSAVDSYDFDNDGNTQEKICSSTISSVTLAAAAKSDSLKLVMGQLDTAWSKDPAHGYTVPGGSADYQLVITNTGTIPISELTLVDILPWVGDVGVKKFTDNRDTQWRPFLAAPIAVPSGASVFYSTQNNPCRAPDLGLDPTADAPGCSAPAWSSAPPADITTVQSFKIAFGSLVLQPGEAVPVSVYLRAPYADTVTAGKIAWNSFGYRARAVGDPDYLPAPEPPRVGIERQNAYPPAYGNYVWLDQNKDGLQTGGEPGVNGVPVQLFRDSDGTPGPSAGDMLVDSTITGPDDSGNPGYYLFSSYPITDSRHLTVMPPGDYYARFTPPQGYGITAQDAGANANDTTDSDVNAATGYTPVTTLDPGEVDITWDLGLTSSTAVGNYVWVDRNQNGLQDEAPGDGVNGVTVRLYTSDGTLVATTLTADSPQGLPGYYLFDNLTPADYYVEFVAPSGFSLTSNDSGDDTQDSDADPSTGRTATFSLLANQFDPTRDAGLTLPAGSLTLGNLVWRDLNNDGLYDPTAGEYGINGVALSLYRNGANVANTVTADRLGQPGWYQFSNLAPGDYVVAIDASNFAPGGALAGLRSSTGNQPTPDPDNNVDNDDNGDPASGAIVSQPITLSVSGEPGATIDGDGSSGNQTLDFGLIGGASLGNFVWFDTNGNGTQDSGEPGVAGVTVELLDSGGNVQKTTITDSAGGYGFADLSAGDYRMRFSGLPAGNSFTSKNSGGDSATDSDADPVTGETALISLSDGQDDLSWDAGLTATLASIGDRAWDDQNRDGVQDAGEPGINGLTVKLYRADGTLVATTTTANVAGTDGIYGFDSLAPGDYYLVFSAIPAGYTISPANIGGDDARDSDADQVTGRSATTTLAPGEHDQSWDIGIFSYASIGDYVWVDLNRDGVQDAGESGKSGVTVRLYRPGSSSPLATTTTDSGGHYSFTYLAPGDYYLEFTLPAGYRTSPRDAGGDDLHDSDPDLSSFQTIVTTLDPTENDTSWDFGIYPTASLGDWVWLDGNANGLQDDGTTGVPGVQVILHDGADNEIDSAVTDATGYYHFTGLEPGNYWLSFILPPTYLLSPQDADSNSKNSIDSDVYDAGSSLYRTVAVTLGTGDSDQSWDMGLYQESKLGDRVWHDLNANGVQDPGEPGIANVGVTLYTPGPDGAIGGGDDVLVDTQTTDASGNYLFSGLRPDSYYVSFAMPAGYAQISPRNSAAADSESDSDVDPTTRQTPLIALGSSATDLSWDMGVYNPASLGNFVWYDMDVNGIQDNSPVGVAGVTVTLFTSSSITVTSTTTVADGSYSFTNLTPGSYYLVFSDLPADHAITRRDQGGDNALDSDATQIIAYTFDTNGNVTDSQITGVTGLIALTSGQSDQTWDAGIYPTIKLGDRVWVDENADGVQDAAETAGVPGVKVALYDGATLVDYTYTDLNGNYLFTDLFPGTYHIVFSNIPAGYLRSPQDKGGDDAADSDADASLTTADFALTASDMTRDLGLYLPASLGDYVWHDQNANGVQDAGEPAIAGATVTLYSAGADHAYGGGDDAQVGTPLTTDVSGKYSFTNLTPGFYYVQFSMPSGFDKASAADRGGDDTTDSDADPSSLRTAVTELRSGESDPTWDAGFYKLASLGDYAWEDSNGNGRQDSGEPFLSGVTVVLSGTDSLGNPVSASSATDSSGGYSFSGLVPGSYQVTFTPPAGYQITLKDNGNGTTPDAIDSDADRVTGQTIVTTLTSGESDPTWDAGLYRPASLGDLLWEDKNGDGVQNDGPTGIAGRTVTLRWAGPDGNINTSADNTVVTTTTNSGGNYSFTNLIPGLYRVEFGAAPSNYAYTTQNSGGDDTLDSDVNPNNGRTASLTLVSGQDDPTWDAGVYQLLSLGNRVWGDVNNNGAIDGAEVGIDGVTVNLYTGAGSLVKSTTTSDGGYYLFSGLTRGDYIVEVLPPAGYISSTGTNGSAGGSYEPAPDPDSPALADSDDNGTTYSPTAIRSAATTLAPAGEPLSASEPDALPTAISNPARDENSDLTLDFGLFKPASLGDTVWLDRNANGVQDGGDETGVISVTVTLYDATSAVVASTATNASGNYQFDHLIPGDYTLRFGLPAGYRRSPTGKGTAASDSDADVSTGATGTITLSAGQSDQTWDSGIYQLVRLGNLVWNDIDNNGRFDSATESGIDGVTVNLTGTDGAGSPVSLSTTTAGGGYYLFDNLVPGDYVVELPASNFSGAGALAPVGTLPAYRSSTGVDGSASGPYEGAALADPDNNIDNDDSGSTDGSGNVRSLAVSLRSQDEPPAGTDTDDTNGNLTLDFGVFRPLRLGNLVWDDVNNNGRFDSATESGIDGVTVNLYRDSDASGTFSAGDSLVASTTTAGGGLYGFSDLFGGDYLVVIPASNFGGALGGYVSSTGTNGSPTGSYEPAADPDSNTDNDDDGSQSGGDVATLAVSLSSGGEPDTAVDGDDSNGNQTVDFGFFKQAQLGDRVWHDQNANGVQESGEPGVAGVSVILFDSVGATVAITSTDSSGIYSFDHLIPGNYYVGFGAAAGYSQVSAPNVAAATGATDSDANPLSRQTATTSLIAGESDQTWDMGVYNLASLGNLVWEDKNGDGVQDAGEPGVLGVTVVLSGTDNLGNTISLSDTTDGSGIYGFGNLMPGSYQVTFTPPAGYQITLQDNAGGATADQIDSDADPTSGKTIITTLVSGESDPTWDAGLYRPASLGDLLWEDLNGDGQQDAGEPGIPGRTITLRWAGPDGALDTADDTTATTATDGSGNYSFSNLIPGSYRLDFGANPVHVVYTIQGAGGASDSDVDTASGRTGSITLASGQSDPTWDAGVYHLLSLGNLVWEDTNNNGQFDSATESGIAGVTVELYRDSDGSGGYSAGDALVGSNSTNASGIYGFASLTPGDYVVVIPASNFGGALSGYVSSSGTNGSAGGAYEPAPDPDGNTDNRDDGSQSGASVAAQAVTLSLYGEPPATTDGDDTTGNQTIDFGFYRPARLGDRVWEDANGDGVQGAGETGVDGVTVTLYDAGNSQVSTTSTAGGGLYSFGNLSPGNYTIVFSGLPSGYALSPQGQGSSATGSDPNPSDGRTATIILTSGQTDLDWDAGIYRLLSLGNLVWDDLNNDGQFDSATESGIAGVSIELYRDDDGSGDYSVGDTLVGNTSTSGGGIYSFAGLAQGDYIVVIPASNFSGALSGYLSSTGAHSLSAGPHEPAPGPNNDSDNDDNGSLSGGRVLAAAVSLSAAGEPPATIDGDDTTGNQTIDFGFFKPASIGDRVWEDTNGDGVQGAGEPGVANVDVSLYDASNNALIDSQTTDASGGYLFGDLPPADYYLIFSKPTGYFFTRRNTGGNPAADSDPDRTSGQTATTTLTSGERDTSWDAGINQLVGLGDTVWEDLNRNGAQDAGEPGVSGVTVTLYDASSNAQVGAPQTTDTDGFYQFSSLAPGRYYLIFSNLPAGYFFTTAGQGGDSSKDSDADPSSGKTGDIDMLSNQDDPTWDAGLYRLASLGDLVWNDLNANGVQDGSESGVSGVTVTLYNAVSGAQVGTPQTTDADGLYQFSGLLPDRYYLVFSNLPGGYIFSPPGRGSDTAADSDADRTSGRSASFDLASGASDTSWDAGIYLPASLGDLVWDDANANGIQESGESGVGGVTVQLIQSGGVISTTVTASDGSYHFSQLGSGDYQIRVLRPSDRQISLALRGGDPARDSDIDRGSGESAAVTLTPGEVNDSLDGGLYKLASVGNRVWEDSNRDGIFDAGERGVAGVTVELYRSDGALVASAVTDNNGLFIFSGIEPGDYYIQFSTPAGWEISPPDQGGDNSVDSDAAPSNGRTRVFSLGIGARDLTWWAGMSRPPTAITLLGFSQERVTDGNMLRWQTGAEINSAGFSIYRSATGRRADAVQVSAGLIVARGVGGGGASYSWLDPSADPQLSYSYWLVEVEISGARHEYALSQPTLSQITRIYLPLVVR